MIDLEEIDKTIELWNSIPKIETTDYEEEVVDFTEDDWTVCVNCDCPVVDLVVTDR